MELFATSRSLRRDLQVAVLREQRGRADRGTELHTLGANGAAGIREDICAEHRKTRRARIAELMLAEFLKLENVEHAGEQRVVVVLRVVETTRRDEPRDRHGADIAATRAITARQRLVRAGLLAAAGDRAIRALGLIGNNDQETILLERGRAQDERNPFLEPPIRLHQSAGLARHAGRIVAVIADVRRDERVVRRRRDRLEIVLERRQRYHVVAGGAVDDRVEPHERIVARRILIFGLFVVRDILRADRYMTARRGFTARIVPHVFHVALPRQVCGGELLPNRPHILWIDTTLAGDLAGRRVPATMRATRDEVRVDVAVGRRRAVRSLTTDQRRVVVEAGVTNAIVLAQERAHRSQRVD